jgi:hypothetical protein
MQQAICNTSDAPTIDPEPTPPALRNAGRVLAAMVGIAAGVAMLVVGGLYALLTNCGAFGGPDTGLCTQLGSSTVDVLETIAVLGGTVAAIAGGVLTAATARAHWITGGLAIVIVLAFVLSMLVGDQGSTLN